MQEKELIKNIKNGSEKAFKTLYSQWVSRLYRFVYQYLKSESATDDVVQETFMRIWTNREHLNPDHSFKSYLFTIAYHFLLKELKRQINNPSMEEYVEYQNNLATKGDEIPNELDYDRFKYALEKAKSHLSPRQREIFELNKEYGISISEIAEKFSITEQVVRNQLSAAIKVLRSELKEYHLILIIFILPPPHYIYVFKHIRLYVINLLFADITHKK